MSRSNIFYLLDLDRCLLNTNSLHMVFDEVVRTSGLIDVNDIIEAKRFVEEASGGSFDTADYVQKKLEELGKKDKWPDIEDEFILASKGYDYLMPGARELINKLDEKNCKYGIITFGGDIWQHVKINASGLGNIPHLVTSSKDKGYLIREWSINKKTPLELGGLEFDHIVLVDDKVISFDGFPEEGAYGYQVRTGKDIVVPEDALPKNVKSVESLYDVIRNIDKHKYV